MASLAGFRASYPEFSMAQDALVSAKLSDATLRTSTTAFSATEADIHIYLLTARLLALSPFGRDMRLSADDNSTVYDDDLRRVERAAAVGLARVC